MATSTRPIGVTIVAVLAWISGALSIISGIVALVGGLASGGSAAHTVIIAIITILLGVVVIIVSLGLFRGRPGARLVVSILFALNLVSSVLLLVTGEQTVWSAVLSAILPVVGLILLWTGRANEFFRR